jgi:hypothetical protein
MIHEGGPNARFVQGREPEEEFSFGDHSLEDVCEIDLANADWIAARDLADWLACDHIDAEDFPAFAAGYIPSWERWKEQPAEPHPQSA